MTLNGSCKMVALPAIIALLLAVGATCLCPALAHANDADDPGESRLAYASGLSASQPRLSCMSDIKRKTLKTRSMIMGRTKTYRTSDNIDYDDVEVRSSNSKIVKCSLRYERQDDESFQAPYYYMLFARGFGSATITITYCRFASFEEQQEGGYSDEYEYDEARDRGDLPRVAFAQRSFKVVVKSGLVSADDCDGLFVGKKYSFRGLFRNALYKIGCDARDEFVYAPSDEGINVFEDLTNPKIHKSQAQGIFLKGKGYKVANKGKTVMLTKQGKVTLRYKLDGKKHNIQCKKIHSIPSFKEKAIKAVRNDLLVPNSMKVLKKTLHYHSHFGLYYVNVKYTAKNGYGIRITNDVNVFLDRGTAWVDWDGWL